MRNFSKMTAKIIGYNSVILICLLIVMEGLCRYMQIPYKKEWTPIENAIARFDPLLGWSYIPNLSGTVRFRERTIKVCFDSHGIRIPDPDFKFDTSLPSILFVGGSYTMGHGLSYEETFPGRLSKEAQFPLQVVNLGVQAYGTDQSFLILSKHISHFNTKFVVYTFLEQHIFRNGNYDRRTLHPGANFLGTKPLFKLNRHNKLILKKKALLYEDYHHSWLWDACKLLFGQELGIYPPYPIKLTHVIINKMQELCEANKAQFIVLYWRNSPYDPKNILDGVDVLKIDLLNKIPELEKLKIPRDGHPNAKANEVVARLLLKTIKTFPQEEYLR